jgi:hypothetical protein
MADRVSVKVRRPDRRDGDCNLESFAGMSGRQAPRKHVPRR